MWMMMTRCGGALAVLVLACACGRPAEVEARTGPQGTPAPAESTTLTAYGTDQALLKDFARWRKQSEASRSRSASFDGDTTIPLAAVAAPEPVAEAAAADAAAPEESITNVQTAGVDEGGIVKRKGDHLIVLRRGRLFTVRIGDDSLSPVSQTDAFGPGIDPAGAWYDEMLVSDTTIVVIGYSYQRGGTELVLFDLSADGQVAYRATYHLRSNDYYSASNYASRLIGDKLVIYSPMFLSWWNDDLQTQLPGLRPWRKDLPRDATFNRILPADRIYRAPRELDVDSGMALHTVTVCDLASRELDCRSTAVLGAPGQTFYVTGDAAYVWTNPWSWRENNAPRISDVFRIPLDGGAPSAMQASGAPIDQMSFLERDGYLNVVVGSQANGQWMWAPEHEAGDLALLRVPLSMFGDGRAAAGADHYRVLDKRAFNGMAVKNRFVGDWLLLGAYRPWGGGDAAKPVFALRYADGTAFQRLQVGHGVERIEAMGTDAILVGNRGQDLHFTSLRLAASASVANVMVRPNAAQGESRTHGFFYRAVDPDDGYVGLPTIGMVEGTAGRALQTASVVFLRNRALALSPAGALDAQRAPQRDDGCKASCVDWYGNARPIFIGERVFALMGYELVEGRYENARVVERRRVDFAPTQQVPIAD